jgi:hypothetical protein
VNSLRQLEEQEALRGRSMHGFTPRANQLLELAKMKHSEIKALQVSSFYNQYWQ